MNFYDYEVLLDLLNHKMWINSEQFGVCVNMHQDSVVFMLVLEVLSHKFCTGVPWELPCANDLVVTVHSLEKNISKLKTWAGLFKAGLSLTLG